MGLNSQTLMKLRETIGGTDEDLAELIDSFLEEAPTLMSSLLDASLRGDLVTVSRSAHSLKSNGRDFGAEELAVACGRIEEASRRGAEPAASDLVAACAAFEDAANELRLLRGDMS